MSGVRTQETSMASHSFTRALVSRGCLATATVALLLPAQAVHAQESTPGRGLTAAFEVDFLKSMIDHHYSALRMSELAAGTDTTRNAELGRYGEGTSPTPGTAATPAKALSGSIRSVAREENWVQREEIGKAQMFLTMWYGQTHEPRLTDMGRQQIQLLESTPAGAEFDHAFLEALARHHYMAVTMATDCLVASDIKHNCCTATAAAFSMRKSTASTRCATCCATASSSATTSRCKGFGVAIPAAAASSGPAVSERLSAGS
jgi:uncharacterized protein (DUF305 family)